MRTILFTAIVAALTVGPTIAPRSTPAPADKPMRVAMLCTKTGEQVSGMNKICYYNCAGSQAAITVGAAQLCPITINQ